VQAARKVEACGIEGLLIQHGATDTTTDAWAAAPGDTSLSAPVTPPPGATSLASAADRAVEAAASALAAAGLGNIGRRSSDATAQSGQGVGASLPRNVAGTVSTGVCDVVTGCAAGRRAAATPSTAAAEVATGAAVDTPMSAAPPAVASAGGMGLPVAINTTPATAGGAGMAGGAAPLVETVKVKAAEVGSAVGVEAQLTSSPEVACWANLEEKAEKDGDRAAPPAAVEAAEARDTTGKGLAGGEAIGALVASSPAGTDNGAGAVAPQAASLEGGAQGSIMDCITQASVVGGAAQARSQVAIVSTGEHAANRLPMATNGSSSIPVDTVHRATARADEDARSGKSGMASLGAATAATSPCCSLSPGEEEMEGGSRKLPYMQYGASMTTLDAW
jgi:hypothetical protein